MVPSQRPPRCRRARMAIDQLETREVPAGIVTVSAVDGHVVLTGDDFDNSVTVSMTTGASPSITFTPDGTTTIDDLSVRGDGTMGQPVTLNVSFQDLHFTAKGGSDVFQVLDPGGLQMPGALVLDMGDGDNTVQIDTDGKLSAGDLAITAGDGFDRCVITAREAGSGLATGRRSHKPVTMSLGDGGFDVSISNFQIPGGGMNFTAGASGSGGGGGAGGTFVADGVTIDGGFSSHTGDGLCSFSWGVSQTGSYSGSGKRLAISMVKDTHVKGDVKIKPDQDLLLVLDHAIVDKSIKVQKKWLPANFRVSVDAQITKCQIDGGVQLAVSGGSSFASLEVSHSAVNGPVSVRNTGPNGFAAFSADYGTCGPVSVQATGPGVSSATASFAGVCAAGACVVRGTDTADLGVVGDLFVGVPGAPQATGGVSVSSSGRSAVLRVDGGGSGGGLNAGSVAVTGFANAYVQSAAQAHIKVAGDLAVKSQGLATLTDLDGDGTVDVAGAVSVSGVDAATLSSGDSWSSGPVSITSRMGPTLTSFQPTTLHIAGDFTSAGGDSCQVFVTPKAPGIIDGSVRVKGGSGDDTVQLFDVDGLQDVQLDLGGGENSAIMRKTIVLPHVLEVSGKLGITSGSGADSITLQDCVVSGISTIQTGGGKDTISVDACTFNGAVGVDAGAGDDRILIGLLMNASAPVVFKSPVAIACGAGNDWLSLGVADNPSLPDDDNSRVVFEGAGNKISGGGGINVYDPQAGHVDGLASNSLLNFSDPTP